MWWFTAWLKRGNVLDYCKVFCAIIFLIFFLNWLVWKPIGIDHSFDIFIPEYIPVTNDHHHPEDSNMTTLQVTLRENSMVVSNYGHDICSIITLSPAYSYIHVCVIHHKHLDFSGARTFTLYGNGNDRNNDLMLFLDGLYDKDLVVIGYMNRELELPLDLFMYIKMLTGCRLTDRFTTLSHVVVYVVNSSFCSFLGGNPPFVSVNVDVKLFQREVHHDFSCFDYAGSERPQPSRLFCERYSSYPESCDCSLRRLSGIDFGITLFPVKYKPLAPELAERVKNTPILVVAAPRPNYLRKALSSLLEASGVTPRSVTVSLDEYNPELEALVDLFGVNKVWQPVTCKMECRISEHYRLAIGEMFSLYPEAQELIILEDDLIVSSDFLQYFATLLPIYRKDSTLFCISAWNDNGYAHSVGDLTMLYRSEFFPGLGWVLSRDIFNQFRKRWAPRRKMNWDAWIRESIIKRRSCIIPDISRTYHIGEHGLHVDPYFQRDFFSGHSFFPTVNVSFATEGLETATSYDHLLEKMISEGNAGLHQSRICELASNVTPNSIIRQTSYQISQLVALTNVSVIKVVGEANNRPWLDIFKCLKLWHLDRRGLYKNVMRLWWRGRHLVIVGCPASPFCSQLKNNLDSSIL